MLFNFIQNPIEAIVWILAIGLAIGVHEAAHAATADHFGDSTAKDLGRTSINPLAHLDPIGTILFLLTGFGWGKPVPVNENRLRSKNDVILVALAGPASNLAIAIILGVIFRFVNIASLQSVLAIFIVINISLMIFNLIPVPPLDGSKILRLFISDELYYKFERNGIVLILIIFLLLNFGFGSWLSTAVTSVFHLITGA